MEHDKLIPHLFRTESGKITAVMTKLFGPEKIDAAEDIVSETFVQALETWPYKGVPDNPRAWLYTVAKHKALNQIQREKRFQNNVASQVNTSSSWSLPEIDLSEQNISDAQLQMLFTVCHPAIPIDSQIALALRILCGFGIEEIANAFLTNRETINKRLFRAKEKWKSEKIAVEFPSDRALKPRLDAVLRTLYLLFSEGYCSETNDAVLREDLCLEAMRLAMFLTRSPQTNVPEVNALLALMCFHASRFAARKTPGGQIILYDDQDDSLWNEELISRGALYLQRSSGGATVTKYHLEAAIAWWYTRRQDSREKWENILHLYNQLLAIEYSPLAALNRIYALSKVHGNEVAIREAEKLQLENNHYYFALLGQLYKSVEQETCRRHFERALQLAPTKGARMLIHHKLDSL